MTTLAFFLLLLAAAALAQQRSKCRSPPATSEKMQRDIAECEEQIKAALLRDFVGSPRGKRETPSPDDRRIAGCLLQCVYRKVKAVDAAGFPTKEGLIRLYTQGVSDVGYTTATSSAVQFCMATALQRRLGAGKPSGGATCDMAFDIFECVSTRVAEYCSAA